MKKLICLLTLGFLQWEFCQPRLPEHYYWENFPTGWKYYYRKRQVPLATIEIAVKNGAFTEDSNYNGLSHLFEHMFFKAKQRLSRIRKSSKTNPGAGRYIKWFYRRRKGNYFLLSIKTPEPVVWNFLNSAIRFPIYRTEDMQKERPS